MSEAIIAAARACLGTPFRHQGRIPGLSLDCAGLIIAVARTIGAHYIDVPAYGRRPGNGLLEAALDGQPCLQRIDLAERRPGDVMLMRFLGDPQHLGIVTDSTLIHAWLQVGKVCEHDLDEDWQARIVRAYRFEVRA